jgi:N utilization substance protein A
MNTALLGALQEIERDKGIPFETVRSVLEESLLAAYENREDAVEGAEVTIDDETGHMVVTKDGEDVTPPDLTRMLANVMRQNFYQRLNEIHNEQLMEEYGGRMGAIVWHRAAVTPADDAGGSRPRRGHAASGRAGPDRALRERPAHKGVPA